MPNYIHCFYTRKTGTDGTVGRVLASDSGGNPGSINDHVKPKTVK